MVIVKLGLSENQGKREPLKRDLLGQWLLYCQRDAGCSLPVHFSLECFIFKRISPPAKWSIFHVWMSNKETRHFKLLTVAEILDDNEGEVRSGTWAYHSGRFLHVWQPCDFDVLDHRSQGWRSLWLVWCSPTKVHLRIRSWDHDLVPVNGRKLCNVRFGVECF